MSEEREIKNLEAILSIQTQVLQLTEQVSKLASVTERLADIMHKQSEEIKKLKACLV